MAKSNMKEGGTIKVRTDGGYVLKCKVIIPLNASVPGMAMVVYPQTGARVWISEREIIK